jgi:hypothetical protein
MSKYLVAKKFFEKKRSTGGLYDAEIEYLIHIVCIVLQ